MNVAIVVAGGQGTRFGGDRPKQFLEINGAPVIIHTLRRFEHSQQIDKVVVVLPADELTDFQKLLDDFAVRKVSAVVAGADTRARSVKNGLAAVAHADVVAVHDAVRPLVTAEEIDQVVLNAAAHGGAILAAAVSDTVKEVADNHIVMTISRSRLRRALTPQAFHFHILKRAYAELEKVEASGMEVTDDSFLVERLGVGIVMVEGSARNIKITNPEDLAVAEALLR